MRKYLAAPILTTIFVAALVVFGPAAERVSASATAGSWSAVEPWPVLPIHAAVTADGKVLTFGADAPPASATGYGAKRYDVWEPDTGIHTTVDQDRQDYFCAIALNVPETGNMLIAGGDDFVLGSTGTDLAAAFDPTTATVAPIASMNTPRWYPTATVLPNGDILMQGGLNTQTTYGITPEVYSTSSGWTELTGATSGTVYGSVNGESRWFYPRSWVAPDGKVFGVTQSLMYTIDPAGSGSLTTHGQLPAAIQGRATSTSVMYEPGKILQVGGGSDTNVGLGAGLKSAAIIDITSGTPVVTQIADMSYARQWANATVLPNGQVLVNGGSDINNALTGVAFSAEIWDPATNAWTVVAAESQERLYHSASVLLPDGRVLSAGGGSPGPVTNLDAQFFTPPYLFDSNGGAVARPAVNWAPDDLAYNGTFSVDVGPSQTISRVTLVKSGATTHSFNADQRFIELSFTQNGNQLSVTAPATNIVATPGYYLLSVIDSAGVVSESAMVSLLNSTTAATAPPADITPPTVTITSPANNATESGSTVSVSGTAADNASLSEVRLLIESRTAGEPAAYWDGSSLTAAKTWLTTTLSGGAFNYTATLPPGQYRIQATAEDASGNVTKTGNTEISVHKVTLSPAGLSKLASDSVLFSWTPVSGTNLGDYELELGPTRGSNTYYDSGNIGTATSATAAGLPTNGTDVWARLLYTPVGGTQEYMDARFIAAGELVSITSHDPSNPLPGSTFDLTWSAGAPMLGYWVWVGPSQGSRAYFDSSPLGDVNTVNVTGVPEDGSTVWIRVLYAEPGEGWRSINIPYTAASGSVSASLTSPADASTLDGASQVFNWSGNADEYRLEVGATAGSSDYFDSGIVTANTVTATGIPTDGSAVSARLSYRATNGSWAHVDSTYVASGASSSGGVSVGFDGGDRIVVGSPSSLQLVGDASWEFWLYPTDFAGRRSVLGKAYSGEGSVVQETNQRLTFYQGTFGGNGAGYQWLQTSPLVGGDWRHLVLVRSGSTLSWYVDGVLDRSRSGLNTPVVSTLPFVIGDGYTSGFDGRLDEVALYGRALSAGEVLSHFNAAGSGYRAEVLGDGPVSYWRLDEGSGPTAVDEMGVNAGTYVGSPLYGQPGATGGGGGSGVDVTPPVISLVGADPFELTVGGSFAAVDPGVSVSDDVDPSPSVSVDVSGLDVSTVGSYSVSYTATDASSNSASVSRVVNVVAASSSGGVSVGFDGGDRIVVGSPSSLQLVGDASWEFWLYPTDFAGRRSVLGKAYSGEGSVVQETNQRLTFYQGTFGGNGAGYQWLQTSPLVGGDWRHLVLVRSGSTLSWYVDGVLDRSRSGLNTPVVSTLPFVIGDGYTSGFDGRLDEVALYGRALSAGEVLSHFNAAGSGYRAEVLGDGPVSYWRLDEGSGPTAVDEMGVNAGTYVGSPLYGQPGATGGGGGSGVDVTPPVISLVGADPFELTVGGSFAAVDPGVSVSDDVDPSPSVSVDVSGLDVSTVGSYSVSYTATDASSNSASVSRVVNVVAASSSGGVSVGFDGGDRIVVGSPSSLQLVGDASWEFWLYPTDFAGRRSVLGKAYSGEGSVVQETNQRLTFYQGTFGGNGAGYQWLQTSPLVGGDWRHLVLVRSGSTLSWYVDGVLDRSRSGLNTPVVSTLPFVIGDGYTSGFDGRLDEVALYGRALSAGEVLSHFNAAGSGYRAEVLGDGPVSYWRLDEGSGPTAVDEMGVNAGTYVGSPLYGQPGAHS